MEVLNKPYYAFNFFDTLKFYGIALPIIILFIILFASFIYVLIFIIELKIKQNKKRKG